MKSCDLLEKIKSDIEELKIEKPSPLKQNELFNFNYKNYKEILNSETEKFKNLKI